MKEEEVSNRRTVNYIEGNTVRKMEAVPQRRSEQVHRELERKQEKDRVREERQREARIAARRNQERALQMSPGYVVFLAVAMAAMVGVCGVYLKLQSDIANRMKTVAVLESQVTNLKTDNDANLKRINTSIDLESIKNTAINELGMVYPSKDQIIYFHIDTSDYMNQYEDIPEK
ncbi:hypothetical protein [Roseburia sp. 499]|uniref:hypothetical protein n=1 Tax=Roseburia sp. 499 TaxID=1261634 RepID=UPI0009524FFC|nr:hypothetical protein [Roseburia sp. 499]WVK70970.1 hypothetical protein BIV20_05390 [Roseburia sp. 499]